MSGAYSEDAYDEGSYNTCSYNADAADCSHLWSEVKKLQVTISRFLGVQVSHSKSLSLSSTVTTVKKIQSTVE